MHKAFKKAAKRAEEKMKKAKKHKHAAKEVHSDGKWIQGAIKHPGALRKELHVKKGDKIPVSKLKKAAKAGGKEGKRARLAITLKKMHK
jgi:hypothetical protein